jgi:cell division protein FtsQ
MVRNDGQLTRGDDQERPGRTISLRGAGDDDAPRGRSVRPDAGDDDEADLDAPHRADLEKEDEEAQFLRGRRRVPVRRGPLPKKAAQRLKIVLLLLVVLAAVTAVSLFLYRYGARSWRFRVDSSDNIEITGTEHVSRRQVMDVMGADIGRNIFFVPLEQRQRQLEQIPWVRSATVMRLLPNRLKIQIEERTPVAFIKLGTRIALIDADGVVMDLPEGGRKAYSFPVITGGAEGEPLSTRAARMKIYTELMRELDSEGNHYSQDISEVDLSDPDDVKVTAADPQGAVVLHLGASNFLARYKLFIAHVAEWRRSVQQLRGVDLRYDRQVIVNPDESVTPPRPAASAPATGKPAPPANHSNARKRRK